MLALRRAVRFRRKLRAQGLKVWRTGTLHVGDIRYPVVNAWSADWYAGTDHDVYASPHYAALLTHRSHGDMTTTPYVGWHRSLRGVDHPRPDDWIMAMQDRLVRLYESISRDGYRLECVADRIAVLPDNTLWDGGNRLACLAALGRMDAPVVWVQ